MLKYQQLLKNVLNNGVDIKSRNGPVRALHGAQVRYDLEEGFPLLTTKKMDFKVIKAELLGFIRGYTHVSQFQELGCNIWNANAEAFRKNGDLGPIYGKQWRYWSQPKYDLCIDQLQNCIDSIKQYPYSRRHIVSAWNPADLHEMCLPPCHVLFQFHVYPDRNDKPKYLSLSMYQRSCDIFLGVPFNIASYSLLLSMIAQLTSLTPKWFIHSLGDVHLYHEHFPVAIAQLERQPLPLPELTFSIKRRGINNYEMNDMKVINYQHHSRLKAKMIV